jgi:hypothetical protein
MEENKNLCYKIIIAADNHFIINILYRRLIRIISNNNRINNNTKALEVTLELGKELIKFI